MMGLLQGEGCGPRVEHLFAVQDVSSSSAVVLLVEFSAGK